MTVSIDIDLDAMDAFQEIANLRLALESLEDDLELDIDIKDGFADILDELSEAMEELSDSFNDELNETIDRLEGLELDDVEVIEGNGDSGGDTGSDSGDNGISAEQYFSGSFFEDESNSPSGIQQALEKFHDNVKAVNGSFDAFEVAERFGGSDDSDDSEDTLSMKEAIGKANSFSGFGSLESMVETIDSNRGMSDEDVKAYQDKIDSVFTQEDFDFQINKSLSNKHGGIWGDTNAGQMSWERYKEVREAEGGVISAPGGGTKREGDKGRILSGLGDKINKVQGFTDSLENSFKRAIPSMSTWINMVGMAVPALAAMAVQAAGVAAAMGSIAVAGGAMIGLGLLGHGDSMAESFRNAKKELSELKKGLFKSFEPTADLFSGIQSEFFDFIPSQMDRVAQSMEGLTVFKDDLFELFRGGTQFVSEFFGIITEHESIISGLTAKFSKLIGQSILQFFEWLLETANKNKQMLINLGVVLKKVAGGVYEVFMMVSRAIIMLKPFFGILQWIGKLLNNSLISGIVATVAAIYILTNVVGFLTGGLLKLGTVMLTSLGPAFASFTTWLATWIGGAFAAAGANASLAASIGLVSSALLTLMAISGIGLLLSAAGMAISSQMQKNITSQTRGSGSSRTARGSTKVINEGDTVNVDMSNADTASVERFRDFKTGGISRGPTEGSYTG